MGRNGAAPSAALLGSLQAALDADPEQPWCMHRLYEEIVVPSGEVGDRDSLLERTEHAADRLVEAGRARHEAVSALAIGVHCQDSVYWSMRSPHETLEEFGPEYESPAVLRRLASHMYCHGL